jgi:hypothetical protein
MKEKTMNSKTNSTIILAQALLWAWIVLCPEQSVFSLATILKT